MRCFPSSCSSQEQIGNLVELGLVLGVLALFLREPDDGSLRAAEKQQ
jgi:hypothetical protein